MVSLTCIYSKRKNNDLLSAETLLTKYEVITSMSVDGFERWICTLTPETQAGGYSIIGSIKLEETKTIYLGARTHMPHSAFSRERQVKWPSTWIDYRMFHPLLSASCPHRRNIQVVVECFGEDSWYRTLLLQDSGGELGWILGSKSTQDVRKAGAWLSSPSLIILPFDDEDRLLQL